VSGQSSTNRRIQTKEAQIGQRQLGGIMEGRMRRRAFVAGIGSFLAQPWAASAVSPVRRYRVGFLDTAPRERNVNFAAFQQVLLEHGYTEGQNLTFEYRSASGRNASFAELASELVSLQVDVIVMPGTPAALAACSATETVPLVMAAAGDPLAIARSQNRPAQNMTGFGASARGAERKRFNGRAGIPFACVPTREIGTPFLSLAPLPASARGPVIRGQQSLANV